MTSIQRSETELLLAHGAWIRALARRLVADEHNAEDLAQDTWLAALQHRGAPVRAARPWLAGILGNLLRMDRRSRARRAEHELSAAPPEEAPSAAETVEAAALGRDLASLVLALEEPFRTAVLLRYYENLQPLEIARRLGVPVRTVNSRLARGIERLRSRWNGQRGGPSRALLLGVGVMKVKLVIAAALVLASAALVWTWRSGIEPKSSASSIVASPLHEEQRGDPAAPATALVATDDTQRTQRTNSEAPKQAPLAAEAPVIDQRSLRGRVLDANAAPCGGVEVVFRPSRSNVEAPKPGARSAADGTFVLEVPRVDGTVATSDPHLVTVSVGKVRASTEVEPLVIVAPGRDLAGRVTDELGSPLSEAEVALEPPPGFMRRFDAVLDSTERFEARTRSDARGAFELVGVPDVQGAELVVALDGFATARVEAPPETRRDLAIVLHRPDAEGALLTGMVIDAEARRIAGATVSLGGHSAVTDNAGEFRLESTGRETATELVAVHPGHLPGRLHAELDPRSGRPAWPKQIVLTLGGTPLSLAGTVVDEKGAARAGIRVWIEDPTRFGTLGEDTEASIEFMLGESAHGDAYWRASTTDADGRFRIEGLLERGYRLGLLDPRTLERGGAGPFTPGADAPRIVFERGPSRTIAGRVRSASGHPVPGVSLSLMCPTYGGILTTLEGGYHASDADGNFRFESIAGSGLQIWLRGDDVMPATISVPDSAQAGEMEITVSVRCHIKVDLGTNPRHAEEIAVLDAEGAELDLLEVNPDGVTRMGRAPLVDGRSASLGVEERACTLVLLAEGREVQRLALHLVAGRLNLIQP